MAHDDETIRGRFILIGAGAVAGALGPGLRGAGFEPAGVVGRSPGRAARLADRLGTVVLEADAVPGDARLVACCVPDDALDDVVAALAARPADWTGKTVLHVSGAHGAGSLGPLAARGAVTLAFHPVQTFVWPADEAVLRGVGVGLSGDDAGREAGIALAKALGMTPVTIEEGDRPLYHLATALVSNGVVTLSAMAHEILAGCGVDEDAGRRLLAPLIAASARNLEQGLPGAVLTGPVVRGDGDTVRAHVDRLADRLPHLVPVVGALVTETVRLAVRTGRLDRDAAAGILDTLLGQLRSDDSFTDDPEP